MDSASVINWDLAVDVAGRLAGPGPRLSAAEVREEVAQLRHSAQQAVGHVHQITGIAAAEGLGADSEDTLVVDRRKWVQANVAGFKRLLRPALEAVLRKRPDALREGSTSQVLGSAVTGSELGAVLSFLSANVLGQFEPFGSRESSDANGKLLLVAPNIVRVQRELNVIPADFKLWVCLHEQTHRVQFAAAPWLPQHLEEQIERLSTSTLGATEQLPERLAEAFKQLAQEMGAKRKDAKNDDSQRPSRARLLELVQSPEDRAVLSHLTAVMSVLEGHANVVMDAVDASIVPSVKTIRRRFEARGQDRSVIERWVRRLLQLDLKAKQYRDGQRFVGHIVEAVGMEQFNVIWESPQNFPSEEELHAPDQWIRRLGLDAEGAEAAGPDATAHGDG